MMTGESTDDGADRNGSTGSSDSSDQGVESAARGALMAELLLDSPQWVHRRIERAEMEPTGESTRHVSIDMTVPVRLAVRTGRDGSRVLVPLGMLRKGPMRGFSIQDPHGDPASVLGTAQNTDISCAMLESMAVELVDNADIDFWRRFRKIVRSLVGPPDGTRHSVADLRALLHPAAFPDTGTELLLRLVTQLQDNFLLVVEMSEEFVGVRTIVKFHYREPESDHDLSPVRPRLTWRIADFGAAESVHFEFAAPTLLLVSRAWLVESQVGVNEQLPSRTESPSATCHLVGRPRSRAAEAEVSVELVPRLYGAMTAARWGSWFMTALLLGIVLMRVFRSSGVLPRNTVAASSGALLLAAAGLLLTWVARSPEDWTTSRILRNARRSLFVGAVLAGLSAGYLTVPVVEPFRTIGWTVAALAALANAVVAERRHRACRPFGVHFR